MALILPNGEEKNGDQPKEEPEQKPKLMTLVMYQQDEEYTDESVIADPRSIPMTANQHSPTIMAVNVQAFCVQTAAKMGDKLNIVASSDLYGHHPNLFTLFHNAFVRFAQNLRAYFNKQHGPQIIKPGDRGFRLPPGTKP